MAARIIHFGIDGCYRRNVLRRAGYNVEGCGGPEELLIALEAGPEPDAVMLDDSAGSVSESVTSLALSSCLAPLILFPNSRRIYHTGQFDLVVPLFTPPQEWLLDLANLILYSRALRSYSERLQEQSRRLRSEAAAARDWSQRERARARQEVARIKAAAPLWPWDREPDKDPRV